MSTIKADNFTWKSGEAGGQSQYTVSADKVILGTSKSWVLFGGGVQSTNGQSYGSFNVSSITINGTADYTINFTNALIDAYFSAQVTGNFYSSTGVASCGIKYNDPTFYKSTSIRVGHQQSNSYSDFTYMSVTINK